MYGCDASPNDAGRRVVYLHEGGEEQSVPLAGEEQLPQEAEAGISSKEH
jgi:hypothetical protein